MALTADRVLLELNTAQAKPEWGGVPAAGVTIYRGAIVAVCQDGTLVPAGAAAPAAPVSPLVGILGIAEHQQINAANFPGTGAFVGQRPLRCRRRPVALPFDAAPSWASFGAAVFAIDDQTVTLSAKDASGNARLQVGTLSGFDLDGTPYVAF